MRKTFIIPVFLSLCILSGCASDNVPETPDGDAQTVGIYEGDFIMWDTENVKSIFMPDFDSIPQEDFTTFNEEYPSVRFTDGTHNTYYLYKTEERELFIDAGAVKYDDKALQNYRQYPNFGTIDVNYTEEKMREAYPLREIEGLSSEDALKMAEDIIERLGIHSLAEPQIYTCTGTVLYDDIEFAFPDLDVPEGIPDKDAYYIYYPTSLEGITCPTATTTFFRDLDYDGSYGFVEIIISADGLEHFNADMLMDYHKTGESAICTESAAAEEILNTIGRAKETSEVRFSSGVLTYIGDTDLETGKSMFYPAWQFLRSFDEVGNSGDIIEVNNFYYVDAQTGRLMS